MWTTENRPKYDRKDLRYPSDLTDADWDFVKPLIPSASVAAVNERLRAATC
jgi:hypothetical protein